jgi:hypothetical protein
MTVALTGYLKSHPALKQEAQLKKVEQSAPEDNTVCGTACSIVAYPLWVR